MVRVIGNWGVKELTFDNCRHWVLEGGEVGSLWPGPRLTWTVLSLMLVLSPCWGSWDERWNAPQCGSTAGKNHSFYLYPMTQAPCLQRFKRKSKQFGSLPNSRVVSESSSLLQRATNDRLKNQHSSNISYPLLCTNSTNVFHFLSHLLRRKKQKEIHRKFSQRNELTGVVLPDSCFSWKTQLGGLTATKSILVIRISIIAGGGHLSTTM